MISPEEQAVIDAARAWRQADHTDVDAESALSQAVDVLEASLAPPREHALTWGQVPAGWEVLAPDGRWYRVTSTHRRTDGRQFVGMEGIGHWNRDPKGPVTARGSSPAIEALGFPEVLEDGP